MVKTDDIHKLLVQLKDIIDYYSEYGTLFWGHVGLEDLKGLPTRRVIALNDYICALADIENATTFIKESNDTHMDKIDVLAKLETRIKDIVMDNISADDIVHGLHKDVACLEKEIGEICGDEIFYYETSSNFRELIQKKMWVLERYFSVDANQLAEIESRLARADKALKNAQLEITQECSEVEKPFPPRPSYTPECYWWYIP